MSTTPTLTEKQLKKATAKKPSRPAVKRVNLRTALHALGHRFSSGLQIPNKTQLTLMAMCDEVLFSLFFAMNECAKHGERSYVRRSDVTTAAGIVLPRALYYQAGTFAEQTLKKLGEEKKAKAPKEKEEVALPPPEYGSAEFPKLPELTA